MGQYLPIVLDEDFLTRRSDPFSWNQQTMKSLIKLSAVLTVCVCGSCTPRHPIQERPATMESYLTYPATAFSQQLRKAGRSVVQEGNLLKAGPHEIRIDPLIEGQAQRDGHWLIGMGVRVFLDGHELPAMRTGAVGVDTTRDAALKTAAEDWGQQYGIVLVHALFPATSHDKPIVSGSYQLFFGPVGLRGSDDIKSFGGTLNQLNDVLGRFANQTFGRRAAQWHGLTVTVAFDPKQGRSSMCHLDGPESPELNKVVSQVSWPASTGYMLKRFYLVVPAR
jgi:hypothetical protein